MQYIRKNSDKTKVVELENRQNFREQGVFAASAPSGELIGPVVFARPRWKEESEKALPCSLGQLWDCDTWAP